MTADLRQRQPRIEDRKHLAFVRTLPCIICGALGTDAAHIRAASIEHGKRYTGKGEKPSDCWTLPLCREHHDLQHSMSELLFWENHGFDPFAVATALYAVSGDAEKAVWVISRGLDLRAKENTP